NSEKVFVDGALGVRVPMRRIALERGASSICVYDTSGPQGIEVEAGLPKLREPWVRPRVQNRCVTQLHYARKGDITPEMAFVAIPAGSGRRGPPARPPPPSSCEMKSHAAAPSFRPTSGTSSSSR